MRNRRSTSVFACLAPRWWALLVLLGLARLAPAQAISPQFFGINYWNMKAGSSALTNPGLPVTNDLQTADLKWMRIGGHRFDADPLWKTPGQYAAAIQYARSLGAEPLVQVPIGLTKDELSSFVAYFQANNLPVTYWAIGNEPDPSGTNANGQENATVWSADGLANEFGYTYSQWVSQYKTLAIRLKNDLPGARLVGPDFRLFYEPLISDYYQKFLNDVGSKYVGSVPLLDYVSFHFYADRPESVMQSRFATLKGLIDNVNAAGRAANGSAAGIRLSLNEVNAFGASPSTELKPWDFGAGQFLVIMAKQAMQQSALAFIPWSIYESNGSQGPDDYSLYSADGSGAVPLARRATLWHLALLSNYRQANLMNGAQSAQPDNVVFLGMRGPAGYTVLILNTTATTTYTYRAALDNAYHGTEQVRIRLEGYSALPTQLADAIGPRTTHLYHLDASGNVLAKLSYATGDTAPRQQVAFRLVNKSTGGYARPQDGLATGALTQYTGPTTYSSLQWLLKPATPGYYYLINQYTGNAIRPQGSTAADFQQEDQPLVQEALSPGSLAKTQLLWGLEYTGTTGYYRLKNLASGKCLRPLGGSAASGVALVQHSYDATLTSEQWRFDPVDAANTPAQARTLAAAGSAPAPAPGAYPNPVATTLTISLDADAGQATLRDATGRVCQRQALGRTSQLDVRALPPGLYLLTVRTASGEVQQKIVKE